jgi:hypothetical protein
VVAAPDGERLLRNDGGTFTDVTAASGLGDRPGASVPIGAVAGDIDNDGIPTSSSCATAPALSLQE